MGVIERGFLGGFRKKAGTMVGARWRNLDVIRAVPRKSNKPATALQLEQRLKFKLVTSLLSEISDLIDDGFFIPGTNPSAMNRAVAYNLKEAVAGTSPNFSINPEKLSFSKGSLVLPISAGVGALVAEELTFTWQYSGLESKKCDPSDTASLLVYNPAKEWFIFSKNAATRAEQGFVMAIPESFAGDTVHAYLSFTSGVKKNLVSNTRYVGSVVIAPI